MKKFIFLSITLLFAFWILGVSVVKTLAIDGQSTSQNYKVTAVEPNSSAKDEKAGLLATQSGQGVDYFLAYPGILPDHFLYPVKMVRDRVWLWLTFNPLKKAQLMLLLADKRLGAGEALINGNKTELGISTLTKGEKYLQQAVAQEKIAKGGGENTQVFHDKLSLAVQKHEEVLLGLKDKVSDSFAPGLEMCLESVRQTKEQLK
jgi:hypothetical protein